MTASDSVAQVAKAGHEQVFWLAAHGGAGVSTLMAATGLGTEQAWRLPGRLVALSPLQVVVVARSHAHGMVQAQAIAATAAGEGLRVPEPYVLVGLALVADSPGKLPKPLAELRHLISGAFKKVWDVPWQESWRQGEVPSPANAPKQVSRLAKELSRLSAQGAVIALDGPTRPASAYSST